MPIIEAAGLLMCHYAAFVYNLISLKLYDDSIVKSFPI